VTHQDGSLVALNVTRIDDESSGSERGHQTTGDSPHLTARLDLTDRLGIPAKPNIDPRREPNRIPVVE
jgi:hypothetical protein